MTKAKPLLAPAALLFVLIADSWRRLSGTSTQIRNYPPDTRREQGMVLMARYYFDMWDGDHKAHDDIGLECASVHAASIQATIAITELAREILPGVGPSRFMRITVRDATGPLFSMKLDFETEPERASA